MKKQISAIVIAAVVATAIFPSPSFAVIPVPPPLFLRHLAVEAELEAQAASLE